MACDCDSETDVAKTVYRDPRTGSDHVQCNCTECGEIVDNHANGRMV